MAGVRVLIVDDSFTIRALLEEVLGREQEIVLVGAVGDAAAAEALIHECHPDVTTIDIDMPGTDGLALLDQVFRKTHAVILSSHHESALDALERGAWGFFEKSQILKNPKGLVRMVLAAAAGKKTRHREKRAA